MPGFKKLSKLHKYGVAISFLALEIFALLSFSFSGSYVVYGALSLALVILLILFNIREINVEGVSSIALFILPLFLYAVITAFGVYSRSHAFRGDYTNAELVFIPLGLLPMSFAGYVLSIDKTFKISTFLTVIYCALGILCLVNLFVNIVNFGFFYTVLYKGYRMYYGGVMSDVAVHEMAYTLEGFKFIEVRMAHYVLFPALLLTSSIALFFISPKQKKLFVTYIVFSVIGALSLIIVPSRIGLFAAVVIILIDAIIFLLKKFAILRKPFGIALKVILGLGAFLFLFLVLNNQDGFFIQNITKNNAFLNKLFNTNAIVNLYNPLMNNVFSGEKFLGFVVDNMVMQNEVHMSGSFIFDSFMTSGVIGVIALIVMLVFGYLGFNKYFRKVEEAFYVKAALIGFVTFYIIYAGSFNSTEYGIFYNIFQPVYLSAPFMIVIFIFSYVLAKGNMAKNEKKEVEAKVEVAEVASKEQEEAKDE